jgi:hypothetical protein
MMTATQVLTKQSGLQFVFEPSTEPFSKITLSIERMTIEDAVRYICDAAGAAYRKDENGIFIIGHKKAVAVSVPAESNSVQKIDPGKVKVLKKIKLQNTDPTALYNRAMFGAVESETNAMRRVSSFRTAKLFGRVTSDHRIDNINRGYAPVDSNITTIPSQPRTGTESGSDIALPGNESANQSFSGGGQRGGGGGFGQGGNSGFGQGGNNSGFGQGGNNSFGQGGNGQTGANVGGTGIIGTSIDYFTYDPTDNSIVVRGYPEDIETLRQWINTFDVAPQQVIIKVEFITTSNSVKKSLGFDWLYQRGSLFIGNRPGSFARSSDTFVASYATGNVSARMRTLMQEGYGKVVNAPMIRTFNNQAASIEDDITTSRWSPQITVSNGTTITTYEHEDVEANTYLDLAPRINGDGTVTMYINTAISDFGQTRVGPDGSEYPDLLTQTIQVFARVKDGETIVLGGLNRKSEEETNQKFPILGDLPIIGQFFRASTKDVNNQELLIFVTPTIVSDESNSGLGA